MQGFQRTGIPLAKDNKMSCSLQSRGEKKRMRTKRKERRKEKKQNLEAKFSRFKAKVAAVNNINEATLFLN